LRKRGHHCQVFRDRLSSATSLSLENGYAFVPLDRSFKGSSMEAPGSFLQNCRSSDKYVT
jgi:hypothetical protein